MHRLTRHALSGQYGGMSTSATEPGVPDWTLGWRLQRALAHGKVSVAAMARELDVSRSTVSRWLNDRGARPRSIYLRRWAELCRVPLEWLAEPVMGEGVRKRSFWHRRSDVQFSAA